MRLVAQLPRAIRLLSEAADDKSPANSLAAVVAMSLAGRDARARARALARPARARICAHTPARTHTRKRAHAQGCARSVAGFSQSRAWVSHCMATLVRNPQARPRLSSCADGRAHARERGHAHARARTFRCRFRGNVCTPDFFALTQTDTHAHTHSHERARARTHTHKHTHKHSHKHTYARTRTPVYSLRRQLSAALRAAFALLCSDGNVSLSTPELLPLLQQASPRAARSPTGQRLSIYTYCMPVCAHACIYIHIYVNICI
jgi:hypothetical protein